MNNDRLNIKASDLDALNVAFAEKVAGWTEVHWRSPLGSGAPERECELWGTPPHCVRGSRSRVPALFTRSADAVIPWLERHSSETFARLGGEPEVFRIYSPAGPHDQWTIERWWLHHDGEVLEGSVSAKTLAHALVIALLRAKGVEVVE